MKGITLFILIAVATTLNATYFACNDYKRNLYVEVWQSNDQRSMTLYNGRGEVMDYLYRGRAQAGNYRYYGNYQTIYVYKNRRQISIRTYNKRRNTTGPIWGAFHCYRK